MSRSALSGSNKLEDKKGMGPGCVGSERKLLNAFNEHVP